MAWQQALGAALVAGGQMSGRNRLEKIEETKRNEERDLRNLQMALMREDQTMQQARERRDVVTHKTGVADAIRARLGIGGEPTDTELQAIIDAGQEGSLSAAPEAVPTAPLPDDLNNVNVTATMPPGRRSLVPNYEQQQVMKATEVKDKTQKDKDQALLAVQHPGFEKSPRNIQQAVWNTAYGTNMPDNPAERLAEIRLAGSIAGSNQIAGIKATAEGQRSLAEFKMSNDPIENFSNLYRITLNNLTQAHIQAGYSNPGVKQPSPAELAAQARQLTHSALAEISAGRQQSDSNFTGPVQPAAVTPSTVPAPAPVPPGTRRRATNIRPGG